MLLRAERRSVGIAVDAVRGMVRMRASKIERVHHAQRDDEFFHSAARRWMPNHAPRSRNLMWMVGAWTGRADTAPGAAAAEVEQRGSRIDAVVRIGTELIGLSALPIGEIVKRRRCRRST